MINSREKGAAGERELANKLKDCGFNSRRGQQYCGTSGDADVIGIPGIHIECKRVEKLNIDKALEQSYKDAKQNEIPVVIHRKNRKGWKVTLSLENFLYLFGLIKTRRLVCQDDILNRKPKS